MHKANIQEIERHQKKKYVYVCVCVHFPLTMHYIQKFNKVFASNKNLK